MQKHHTLKNPNSNFKPLPLRKETEIKFRKHRRYWDCKFYTVIHENFQVKRNPRYVKHVTTIMAICEMFYRKGMSRMNIKEMTEIIETANKMWKNKN